MTRLERLKNLPGKPVSVWLDTTPTTDFPRPNEDIAVDVAVVGGGIAGLSAAMLLVEAGKKVAIIEAGRIVEGVTGNTTAKLTAAHGHIYGHLQKHFGEEGAKTYAEANQAGIELVATLSKKYGIDCDFRRMEAYTYCEKEDEIKQIQHEAEASAKAGLEADLVIETPLPFAASAVRYRNQAEFHPRKYLLGLAKEITKAGSFIFEETRAMDLEEGEPCCVVTDRGRIIAGEVVMASHFPFHDKAAYFSRMAPYRSYVLGLYLEGEPPEGMFYTEGNPELGSMRTQKTDGGTLVIVGGQGHKAGQGGDTIARYEGLEKAAREKFKVRTVAYRWSAQDYVTADKLPYIGLHTPVSKRVYVVTGFGEWGMSTSGMAAIIIRDLITGKKNDWAELFNPNRVTLAASALTLMKEGANVAKEYIVGKLATGEKKSVAELEPGDGELVEVGGGETRAVYKAPNGQTVELSPVCTHMGCTVSWNSAEETWDCPCHGSRFDKNGEVVQGPALTGLERKN